VDFFEVRAALSPQLILCNEVAAVILR